MQASLRTHLVAGTAALGVTVIVLTPITQPAQPAVTGVALAGWNSPLTEAFNSAILATNYLLNPISPNITPTTNYWDYSGIGPIVQAALDNDLPFDPVTNALNTFRTLGVVPQIVADGLPIATQLVTNVSGYLTDIVSNAFYDGAILSEAVWNLPGALITATRQVIAGDVPGALSTLRTAVIDPIVAVGQNVYTVGARIVGQVVTHVTNLVAAIPGLAHVAAVHIAGTLNLLGQEVAGITYGTVAAIRAGDAEGAWSLAVDGLLGPSGMRGLIFNETIGAGVQTGPVATPSDIPANFVPSIRSFLQTSAQTSATAIGSPAGVARPTAAAPRVGAATATASARGAVRVGARKQVSAKRAMLSDRHRATPRA